MIHSHKNPNQSNIQINIHFSFCKTHSYLTIKETRREESRTYFFFFNLSENILTSAKIDSLERKSGRED